MIDAPGDDRSTIEHEPSPNALIDAWEIYSRDTSEEIERRKLAAAWGAPAWRKLQMAAEMSQTARDLTLAGLRHRHPGASERELRFRLAELLFDTETARQLCDWQPEEDANGA